MTDKVYLVLFILREPCTACIYTAKIYHILAKSPYEASPIGCAAYQLTRLPLRGSCRVATEEDKTPI